MALRASLGLLAPLACPMRYEKVIAIVDYTSTLVNSVLGV